MFSPVCPLGQAEHPKSSCEARSPEVLITTICTVNRMVLTVSATIHIFGETRLSETADCVDLMLSQATMCGNLAIRNQILTQFGLSNVPIRT
jgi:hypothetical protein